jgi:hypothetical protein
MTQDEFYEKIPEWISKPKNTWNHITLMAYFCHKYESVHGVRFRLVRWKSDPGKGKESRDFSKLFKTFAPENYTTLPPSEKKKIREVLNVKIYNYINWMFDYKFRRGDRSVTGTKIFLLPSMINEFERLYSSFLSKKASSDNMSSLISWAKESLPSVFENHQLDDIEDLKMIKKYKDFYELSEDSAESVLISKAIKLGVL